MTYCFWGLLLGTFLSGTFPGTVQGQQSTTTSPIVGIRTSDASPVLLHGGTVVTDPGSAPEEKDVLIRGNTIVSVGEDIEALAGTQRIDVSGKRIYAGLIDAMREVSIKPSQSDRLGDASGSGYWNKNITPNIRAADVASQPDSDLDKLRSQGFTVQLLAPSGGIVKGASCAVLMVDPKHSQRLLKENVFQHVTITVPRGKRRDDYPNSPMGATALLRQTFSDAAWYRDAQRARKLYPALPRPELNLSLAQIGQIMESGTFVFDAANERMAQRSIDIAEEFSLSMVLRGSGREYRELDQIAATGKVVLLPVDFPKAPDTKTAQSIRETSLVDWMHWHFAPENPGRLEKANVSFCLTSDTLDDPGKLLSNVRKAVDRGLSAEAALAALTETPAKVLGIERFAGRVEAGMLASLVITDGDLFDDKTKVQETWVAGERFVIEKNNDQEQDRLVGSWKLEVPIQGMTKTMKLVIEKKKKSLSGKIALMGEEEPESTEEAEPTEEDVKESDEPKEETKEVTVALKDLIRQRERMTASIRMDELDNELPTGSYQLTILTVGSDDEGAVEPAIFASVTCPDGSNEKITLERIVEEESAESEAEIPKKDQDEDEDEKSSLALSSDEEIDLVFPLGAYGLAKKAEQRESVLFRGATVWTSGPDGKIANCDVLVKRGKIVAVGVDLETGDSCEIIDCRGKHITAGLIDCHSHAATDGGINESGQSVTAEVRIGDFIDNSDISIYRQLAGGVTTVNILHGSANPIGGQNQVVKFRWGESMDAMKFADAPPGIKFALGENVKRMRGKYPDTRMGVEQLLRDQFLAARQYEADRRAWEGGDRSGLPPRRDLQLDAIVEIQNGERWIHCHSYRQDEITATLDVLDEFHIQIGTLQHILEGYKVADRMAKHGAMASSFADWWAYKYEVFDAIPYNGVLMHDAGVVVSFNSDDPELARHLNTEAAKAVKYGGVDELEALKFVTLNPAKQLRIDDRVGSIEVGKDADLVVWSGRPLSTTSRCEQTWIDGKMYFSIDSDRELRKRDQKWRARLIQLAADVKKTTISDDEKAKRKDKVPEEKRWLRYDEFCNAGGQGMEVQQ
ncbi:amidohydrolase family protein [Rubripirellula obstinata]|uniref:amidohydrolase family protein n=1 Tax=Rubripirellula obstinata TaxID=406547 RepID=UPI001F2885D7|nr:amidohydrolase family protein [Rubripirellula obstinata]